MSAAVAAPSRMNFYRAGGLDQVQIDTGADILGIETLDPKLWVALSCPVKGLEFDERTLALLDIDKDSRVRVSEITTAIRWLKDVLRNPDELTKGQDGLPLASINDATTEGKRILGAAKHVLEGLGKAGATVITVADTMQTALVFKQARYNGDGIVPPATVDDDEARKVAEDMILCLGGELDRSGNVGISAAKIELFWKELEAFSAWWAKAEADAAKILPLGVEGTPRAYAALQAVRAKIDDYFGRCRLAAYDARALAALNREETAYLALAAKDMTITAQEVAGFPIARVEAAKSLPLLSSVNPAWAKATAELHEAAVAPFLGKKVTELSEAQWTDLLGRFAENEKWHAAKAGAACERLTLVRVRAILAGKAKEVLDRHVAKDKALEPEIAAIEGVERLARYYRDFFELLNNFVSFTDFYSRRRKAIFQAGTLYLDGRACELCIRVGDAGKHATMAALAKSYLAYCDCTRFATGEKMTIAAAFTAGDSDYLMVGRNGLFYDRKGQDWDATITKVIENPISIGQAFWSPYKRVMRWIEEQVAKRAAAADADAPTKIVDLATPGAPAAPGAPAPKKGIDIGVVAALGVAVGGITAALGALLQAFFGLGFWMPLGFVGLILLVSGPAMVIAWLKLRQRNLGPILDANGWAVNGRVLINIPLGTALTSVATLPPGAKRSLFDPYAPKKRRWPRVLAAFAILTFLLIGIVQAGYGHYLTHAARWVKAKITGKADDPPPPTDKNAVTPADKSAIATPPKGE